MAWFIPMITSAAGAVGGAIATGAGAIASGAGAVGSALGSAGSAIGGALSSGVGAVGNALGSAGSAIAEGVGGLFGEGAAGGAAGGGGGGLVGSGLAGAESGVGGLTGGMTPGAQLSLNSAAGTGLPGAATDSLMGSLQGSGLGAQSTGLEAMGNLGQQAITPGNFGSMDIASGSGGIPGMDLNAGFDAVSPLRNPLPEVGPSGWDNLMGGLRQGTSQSRIGNMIDGSINLINDVAGTEIPTIGTPNFTPSGTNAGDFGQMAGQMLGSGGGGQAPPPVQATQIPMPQLGGLMQSYQNPANRDRRDPYQLQWV